MCVPIVGCFLGTKRKTQNTVYQLNMKILISKREYMCPCCVETIWSKTIYMCTHLLKPNEYRGFEVFMLWGRQKWASIVGFISDYSW